MTRNCRAEISTSAIQNNISTLKKMLSPEAFFCPVVKANSYGHDAILICEELQKQSIKHVGVAFVEEAMELRESHIRNLDILTFGAFSEEGVQLLEQFNLTPVVSSMHQLQLLAKKLQSPRKIHLKFNTGMNRLGFQLQQAKEVLQFVQTHKNLQLDGLCTHMADGEDGGDAIGVTHAQIEKFKTLITQFPTNLKVHALNSSSLFSLYSHFGQQSFGARPGLSLYGIQPEFKAYNEKALAQFQTLTLEPVMQLKSEIVQFHELKAGEKVSYGGKWQAMKPSVVAVAAVGYADGLNRRLSPGSHMLFRGEKVPIVGTICMDYTMLDVTEVIKGKPGVPGEEVVIFGRQGSSEIRVEELSDKLGTIPYEVFTGLGQRVPRKKVE